MHHRVHLAPHCSFRRNLYPPSLCIAIVRLNSSAGFHDTSHKHPGSAGQTLINGTLTLIQSSVIVWVHPATPLVSLTRNSFIFSASNKCNRACSSLASSAHGINASLTLCVSARSLGSLGSSGHNPPLLALPSSFAYSPLARPWTPCSVGSRHRLRLRLGFVRSPSVSALFAGCEDSNHTSAPAAHPVQALAYSSPMRSPSA